MSRSVATPVAVETLRGFAADVLRAVGVPPEAASLTARSLAESDARGIPSHGAVRLLPVYVSRLRRGATNSNPDVRIVSRRGTAAVVDGDGGLGQVVGSEAMRQAITMAGEHGSGVVGVRNSSHFGAGSFFAEQAVAAGMIGIAMSNAPANMPPAGGRSRFFGTNPLTIGAPGPGDRPLVLDMATSVVARGKIVLAQQEGRAIPPGWAINPDGLPTEDPAAALRGAVLPMAGYKGAGLALMIDLLCGVLTGAAFGPHIIDLYDASQSAQNVGHIFVAIDVEAFMPLPVFRKRVGQFAAEIRAQPRQPGVERIVLPGEIELDAAARSERDGLSFSEAGWRELDVLAAEYGVTPLGERLATGSRTPSEAMNGFVA